MSRNKGQRAERAVIELLQPVVNEVYEKHGLEAPKIKRNGMQSDGGGWDLEYIQGFAVEVKHQEVLQVEKWWQQTVEQAKGGREPVLFYKQNNVKFRVRIWTVIPIHGGIGEWLQAVVEIDVPTFLEYFRKRLSAELQRGKDLS